MSKNDPIPGTEKHLSHNLYKGSLTIVTIISIDGLTWPCSAIHSYAIYRETFFWKIKKLPPAFWANNLKMLNSASNNANALKKVKYYNIFP